MVPGPGTPPTIVIPAKAGLAGPELAPDPEPVPEPERAPGPGAIPARAPGGVSAPGPTPEGSLPFALPGPAPRMTRVDGGSRPADRFHGVVGEVDRVEAQLAGREVDPERSYVIYKVQEHRVCVCTRSEGLQVYLDGKLLREAEGNGSKR